MFQSKNSECERLRSMKIAVMYICTGKYEKFWDEFYRTSEEFFYPGVAKHYFVFTESFRIMEQEHDNVSYIYQKKSGWPYDTLLRFHWFAMVQDQIEPFDFCYYCNANSVFVRTVTPEVIPFPTQDKPLILWCHTAHYDDYISNCITTEQNPESTAFIGPDVPCRQHGGGFFGGTRQAFLKMTLDLRNNIQEDLNKGIIAVWHDQSHIIKYGAEHPYLEVAKDLICQEERNPVEGKCVMVFLAKDKSGGIDNLRENGWKPRARHTVIKIYHRMLKVADAIKLGGILRRMAEIIPGRREWYR